jgi:hypothetical protein
MTAERRRAAGCDRSDHAPLDAPEMSGVRSFVSIAVAAKYVGQFERRPRRHRLFRRRHLQQQLGQRRQTNGQPESRRAVSSVFMKQKAPRLVGLRGADWRTWAGGPEISALDSQTWSKLPCSVAQCKERVGSERPRPEPPARGQRARTGWGRKRARTLVSDRAPNVPLRQKGGGLRPPSPPRPLARTDARS